MEKTKYTLEFAKDFIEDMEDYFVRFPKYKTNYITFNVNLNENLDFELLNQELNKVNMSMSFDDSKGQWQIFKN